MLRFLFAVSLSGDIQSMWLLCERVYGPLPAAGASRRRWLRPCSSRWSRRKAAPSRYSASLVHMQPETHIQRVRPGSDAFTTTIIATCLISADLLDIDPRHYSDNTQLCLYKAVITGLHNNRSVCYYLCLSFFELKEFTFSVFSRYLTMWPVEE